MILIATGLGLLPWQVGPEARALLEALLLIAHIVFWFIGGCLGLAAIWLFIQWRRTAFQILGYGLLFLVSGLFALFERDGYSNCLIAAIRDYEQGAAIVFTPSLYAVGPHVQSTRNFVTSQVFNPLVPKRRQPWWRKPWLFRGKVTSEPLPVRRFGS